jgi:hypothetical protein
MLTKNLLLFALALCVSANSFSQTKRKTIIPEITEEEKLFEYQNPVDFSSIQIDLLPSPFTDNFYVKTSRTIERIQVIDQNGQEVMRLDEGNELNMSHLALGEYVLRVTFSSGEAMRVIQKN